MDQDQIIHLANARQVPACTVVIFGASGDLAMRKLIPALYSLDACGDRMLADETMILGCARRPIPLDQFRQHAREAIKRYSEAEVSDACWDRFSTRLDYLSGIGEEIGAPRRQPGAEGGKRCCPRAGSDDRDVCGGGHGVPGRRARL